MNRLALLWLILAAPLWAGDPTVTLPLEAAQPDPTKLVKLTPVVTGGGAPEWYFPDGGIVRATPDEVRAAWAKDNPWGINYDRAVELKLIEPGDFLKLIDPKKPGSYRAFCYVGNDKQVVSKPLAASVCKVTFGRGTPIPPAPDPIDPNPPPAGLVAGFVVVEDTSKAEQYRGTLATSPKVLEFVRAQKLKHRVISTAAEDRDGKQSAEVAYYLKKAEGKPLPYLITVDGQGNTVTEQKVPQDPEAFVKALGGMEPHRRAMGNIPPPEGKLKFAGWKVYGDAPNTPIIPRDQWKEIDLGQYLPPVYDQDGVGACNAFATVTAVEAARAQAGLPYVKLSTGYLYGKINGGQDQGSLLEDGLAWMSENGTCTIDKCGYLEWQKGRRGSAAMEDEAKSYKVIEAYLCPNFDALASAIQRGFFIVEGVMWYGNYEPGADGWIMGRGQGGPGGHALCGYGVAKKGDVWGIRTRNSWNASWGIGGNCILAEPCFRGPVGGWWAVRAVTSTPTDFPYPKQQTRKPSARDFAFALAY